MKVSKAYSQLKAIGSEISKEQQASDQPDPSVTSSDARPSEATTEDT